MGSFRADGTLLEPTTAVHVEGPATARGPQQWSLNGPYKIHGHHPQIKEGGGGSYPEVEDHRSGSGARIPQLLDQHGEDVCMSSWMLNYVAKDSPGGPPSFPASRQAKLTPDTAPTSEPEGSRISSNH